MTYPVIDCGILSGLKRCMGDQATVLDQLKYNIFMNGEKPFFCVPIALADNGMIKIQNNL